MTSMIFALISMFSADGFDATVLKVAVDHGGTVFVCNGKGADIETKSGLCVKGLSDDKVQAVDAVLASQGRDFSGCMHVDGICLM